MGMSSDDEKVARRQDVVAWLVKSRGYSTALHHLEILTIDRTRDLLRAGADVEEGCRRGCRRSSSH